MDGESPLLSEFGSKSMTGLLKRMTALGLGLTLALGVCRPGLITVWWTMGVSFPNRPVLPPTEAIQKIAKDHKFDLYLETMDSLPFRRGQDAKDKQKLDRWVTEFAAKKAKEKSVKGLIS